MGSHSLLQGTSRPRDWTWVSCIAGRFFTIWSTREAHMDGKSYISRRKQAYHIHLFSSSHGRIWELDHKEGWTLKNWCFQTVGLEKTLENPLDSKEIKPVNPKGNQPWIATGRIDAEALVCWPPDVKIWLSGRLWCWERLRAGGGVTETVDEMVGWHHQLNGHEFEQTLELKDREAWHIAVHGVAKSWMQLSDLTKHTSLILISWLGLGGTTWLIHKTLSWDLIPSFVPHYWTHKLQSLCATT